MEPLSIDNSKVPRKIFPHSFL
ncbi:MAG: hypothetical protein JWQ81_4419, partial [Amycolatopsis sp.]|nr:hypothetical protein [Amycolatopsis sp.]